MLVAAAVREDLLLAVLTVLVEQGAAALQVQQTQPTLEQSTRAAVVLAIPMAQTTQLLDTLAATAVQALSLFGTPTLLLTLQPLAVD
jgi:predicted NAD/FAD-dependent oxidoreductase